MSTWTTQKYLKINIVNIELFSPLLSLNPGFFIFYHFTGNEGWQTMNYSYVFYLPHHPLHQSLETSFYKFFLPSFLPSFFLFSLSFSLPCHSLNKLVQTSSLSHATAFVTLNYLISLPPMLGLFNTSSKELPNSCR